MLTDLRAALVAFLALCCVVSAVGGVALWKLSAWLIGHVTLGLR